MWGYLPLMHNVWLFFGLLLPAHMASCAREEGSFYTVVVSRVVC